MLDGRPSGAVLGIDRSADAIATAQQRAAAASQGNVVRFAAGEIDALAPGEAFDVLIGRLILMYLPEMIRRFLETSDRYGYWNATPEENAQIGLFVPPVP